MRLPPEYRLKSAARNNERTPDAIRTSVTVNALRGAEAHVEPELLFFSVAVDFNGFFDVIIPCFASSGFQCCLDREFDNGGIQHFAAGIF